MQMKLVPDCKYRTVMSKVQYTTRLPAPRVLLLSFSDLRMHLSEKDTYFIYEIVRVSRDVCVLTNATLTLEAPWGTKCVHSAFSTSLILSILVSLKTNYMKLGQDLLLF